MNILSFDTSNNLASVAIVNNNKILSYTTTEENSQQAEKLFLLIDQCLTKANLELSDINLVSVTSGPGSFTGVRIAIAAALGMQTGINIPFIALTNFQVLAFYAQQINATQDIAVILDARRDQFYCQSFNMMLEPLDEPQLISLNDINKYLLTNKSISIIGDGIDLINSISSKWQIIAKIKPDAAMLGISTKFFWQKESYHDLIPLYIRQPDASLPKSI